MVIPGYDPEDLNDRLEELLSERDRETYLTPEEQAQYEAGENLVDLLSTDDIRDLLDEERADT
ncbi:hypothetical protein E6P09_16175 (plasmid) [Haloferax mediterranei ATCC 33500]|uniref:DUF8027 domain-containing protein n=1 Tax=Haloferax mediterranei (strain ATCC 33500 / DSM 1411 / JCM 8866 / NBRC 14739 / NCIMB 2177 / R-4) TaxID=523841 RepID=I3RB61_HALMT|nr:hypothetical protein [Haloferax mediterranei]AFK21471.1 hypothetical protein HFX_6350 [Haloferax mediterranei ATCC 33500]AHZ24466.1 hypothetical protein BM92_16260 [Haloferax mediterranei ATCC 33500]ELZ97213.1 hypothetical protein C439_17863 [Haloferax mediterranei ATCC 33500]MDX5990049.1 hypothetical protein [Haloferax mediterranei ATCC 33500]QCQ76864.1 hypothetical protein E6P09_16175 [Haloferax mediterranei ATCC 33500]